MERNAQPEAIDFDQAGESLMRALEKRRTRREPDAPPVTINALAIARCFGLRPRGSRDSQRRAARLLIEHLRGKGLQICAVPTSNGGYYLPTVAADLADYARTRRLSGLTHLAAASSTAHSPIVADAAGQLQLPFDRRSNAR